MMKKSIFLGIFSIVVSTVVYSQKNVETPITTLSGMTNDALCLSKHNTLDYLATGTWDHKVLVYKNDSSLNLVTTLSKHLAPVTAVTFSKDGKILVTASNDKSIIMWDSVWQYVRTFEGHTSGINTLLIDPSRRFLISGSDDRQIMLWSLENGKLLKKIDHGTAVRAFAQSNDIRSLYVAGNEPVIKQYAIGSWAVSRTFAGHTDVVNDIAISANGKYMISGSNDKSARIWDLSSGKELKKLPVDCWKVQAVSFSRDSRYAATGCNDGSIKIWEVESGKLIANISSTGENIKAIAFSKYGNQIISASSLRARSDYGLRIWPTYIPQTQPLSNQTKQDSSQQNPANKPASVQPATTPKSIQTTPKK